MDGLVRGSSVPWWVNVCRCNYKMHLVFHRGTIQLGRLPGHYLLNKFYKNMTHPVENFQSDHSEIGRELEFLLEQSEDYGIIY